MTDEPGNQRHLRVEAETAELNLVSEVIGSIDTFLIAIVLLVALSAFLLQIHPRRPKTVVRD